MEKKKTKVKEKDEAVPLMHGFDEVKSPASSMKITVIVVIIAIVLGTATGYFLATSGNGDANSTLVGKLVNKSTIPSGKVVGVQDEKKFKMSEVPEGTLVEGGIDGEGAYHLEREGGAARNVYLTSSNIDLSQFLNRKVKVWGNTQAAQKAGWLLDVERLEVLH